MCLEKAASFGLGLTRLLTLAEQDANLEGLGALTLLSGGQLTAQSMALVRVLSLRTPREAHSLMSALLPASDGALEQRALAVVRRLAVLALEELPSSLEEDQRALTAPSRGGAGARTALQFRVERKRILSRAAGQGLEVSQERGDDVET